MRNDHVYSLFLALTRFATLVRYGNRE